MLAEKQAIACWFTSLILAIAVRFWLQPSAVMRVPAVIFYLLLIVVTALLARRLAAGPPVPQALLDKDLTGQIAIVTGAASGLGFETALQLAKQGATVIVGCRSVKRNEECATMLRERARADGHTNKELAIVTKFAYNAEDLSSAKAFATGVLGDVDRIDVLVLNAGLVNHAAKKSSYGNDVDYTLLVNDFSHMVVSRLLSAKLIASGGRVVIVSSYAHTFVAERDVAKRGIEWVYENVAEWAATSGVSTPQPWAQYGLSKLQNIYHCAHLRERGVAATCLEPGFVATSILSDYIGETLNSLQGLIAPYLLTKTASEGASTQLFACLADPEDAGLGREGSSADPPFLCDTRLQPEHLSSMAKNRQLMRRAIEASWRIITKHVGELE